MHIPAAAGAAIEVPDFIVVAQVSVFFSSAFAWVDVILTPGPAISGLNLLALSMTNMQITFKDHTCHLGLDLVS